jgi:dTDP-glucose pyrophosphorylase
MDVFTSVKPVLLIMAAGLGSRYGGLKQLAPIDAFSHAIIDYSIYDAVRAGFEQVVCVIAPGMESDFHEAIGRRIAHDVDLHYAEQRMDMLPAGYSVPEGRVRPWGTAHAVLCAKEKIDGPFCAINADDFYGRSAFSSMYRALEAGKANEHAMCGYCIENTLTENGTVSRGVCSVQNGLLTGVVERTKIKPAPGGAAYTEDGENWIDLPAGTPVSMNMWGFGSSMMDAIEEYFAPFLETNIPKNPLLCEYYLPYVVNRLIEDNRATVRVLACGEKWYGITYMEDLPAVRNAIERLGQRGEYPEALWQSERQGAHKSKDCQSVAR